MSPQLKYLLFFYTSNRISCFSHAETYEMGIRFGGFNCSAKGTESPGELAPSSSCMLLTPGKFKKNVSDRTEFAYHLHKNLQLLVSLDIVHLGICARVEKHFIGTEWSLAAHLYAKYYLYLKD